MCQEVSIAEWTCTSLDCQQAEHAGILLLVPLGREHWPEHWELGPYSVTGVQPIEEVPPDSILVPVFNYATVLISSAKIPDFQLRMPCLFVVQD